MQNDSCLPALLKRVLDNLKEIDPGGGGEEGGGGGLPFPVLSALLRYNIDVRLAGASEASFG